MELSSTETILHLRLNSCLETVLEFQRVISRSFMAPELDGRFNKLIDLVSGLNSHDMAEKEVEEVESATNSLLGIMKPFLDVSGIDQAQGQILN